MAYVPPHRRVQSSSKPETPVNRLYKYPAADDGVWSIVFMWFSVDENVNPPANVQIEFKPFPCRSFPRILDRELYTISVNPHPMDDMENGMRSLTINETHPWRYMSEKIKGDLRECFQRLENHVKESKREYDKPAFTIRFGKVLFYGVGLSWHEYISVDTLEKFWKCEMSHSILLRKIFDRHISKDIFEALKEKIITSLESPTLKEKVVYIIMIELDPLKRFIADTSCLNKLMDCRFMATEKYLIDLHEEDKESVEGIVKSARIEEGAKGGVQWPNGGLVRNRFKVTGAWTLNVTTIVGKTWDMKFQQANRVNLADSSGGMSNEIDIKLKSITKYLRDRRQWEEEKIMNLLEDSLKWVWINVLQEHNLLRQD